MSRTPLFGLLRRSFRLARLAADSGRPVEEVVGACREARRAGIDRRQFLRGTAAATGLALAGCRPFQVPPRRGGPQVLVVGAGIAGLTAAHRLHQRGVAVRVLEGQDRVGGRMYSLRDLFPDGQVAELGGELIDTRHIALRRLVEELAIPLDDYVFDDPGLDADAYFFAGRRVSEEEVVRAFVPVSDRLIADLSTLEGDWVTHREPAGGEPFDTTSAADWLASVAAEPWMKSLLDVGYTTEYGLELGEQSALNVLLMLDPHPSSFRMFGDSDERFHVRGGNDRIPHALAERLGDRVETGARVEAIARRADGTFAVSVRRGASSEDLTADHVVVAVPFTMLRGEAPGPAIRLDDGLRIPEVQRRAIRELGYGTNSKLMVGFSERLWRQPEAGYRSNGSTITDLAYQLSWETSRLQPGTTGILTNFTGGRHGLELASGTAAEQAAAFTRDLDRLFPGVAAVRLDKQARFTWPSFPWTRGSYASYRPGQWTGFGGEEGRRVGNLHFAGEHTSQSAQGFMEGGCESGERVAEEILPGRARAALAPTLGLERAG